MSSKNFYVSSKVVDNLSLIKIIAPTAVETMKELPEVKSTVIENTNVFPVMKSAAVDFITESHLVTSNVYNY